MSSQTRASRKFESVPATIRAARRFVAEAIEAAGNEFEDVLLFTSELVSNAVQHAETAIEVVVIIDAPTLRIEVHDGFSMTEAFRLLVETERDIADVDGLATNGRGLLIVRSMAVGFGVIDKGENGKAVWFELAADRPSLRATRGESTTS